MTDRCRSCGAEIVWAKIEDKTTPLNKRRVRAYLGEGTEEAPFQKAALVRISHFLTCPNASSHSRTKA